MAAITMPTGDASIPIADTSVPTPLMICPISMMTGAAAATIPRIFRIISSCSGVRLRIASATCPMTSAAFSRTGARIVPTSAPTCAIVPATCAFSWSMVSFVALSELIVSSSRISPRSSACCPNCFKAAPPSSTIPASESADFPKIVIASWSRSVSFSTLESASSAS